MNKEKSFEALLSAVVDGEIQPSERERLKIYLQDPTYRDIYERYIDLHAEFEFGFPASLEQINQPKAKWYKNLAIVSAVAAVICLLLVVGVSQRSESEFIAKITNSVDADFIGDGNYRKDSVLELKSGFVELQMDQVKLIVEAPAKLQFIDASHATLLHGRAVVRTENQNISYTLTTERVEVTNLGVEFCVYTNPGKTEVHAIQGGLVSKGMGREIELAANQAMLYEGEEEKKIAAQPDQFIRALPGKSIKNPDFIHWSFDYIDEGTVIARSKGLPNHGAKIHSDPIFEQGVFGNGVKLDGVDDFLSTEFPGIEGNNPRTVALWVKVPKDARVNNAISMLAWGSYQSSGNTFQIAWNWSSKDGLVGALRAGLYHGQIVGSTDLRDGKWHHIAIVTYGGDQADVSTHILMYIDGQLHSSSAKSVLEIDTDTSSNDSIDLLMGRAADNYQLRNKPKTFKGSIDEAFIFDGALDGKQIRSLMRTNGLND